MSPMSFAQKKRRKSNLYAYFHLAPFLILLLTFSFFPIIFTFIISFNRWNGFTPMEFVGLTNYIRMLDPSSRFFQTILNTFIILGMSLPFSILFGLVAAHLLNSTLLRRKKFYQLSFFLPFVVTPVALGLMFSILFDFQHGTVNHILMAVGLLDTQINWLGSVMFSRIVVAILLIWRNFGYTSVMFLAGITSISPDLMEAASIEGASSFQVFRKISIPLLKPIIVFVVITGVIGGLQLFEEVYLLFAGGFSGAQPFGGPRQSVLTMVMNFYDAGFRFHDMGFAAALAYGMFLVIIVFTLTLFKIIQGKED